MTSLLATICQPTTDVPLGEHAVQQLVHLGSREHGPGRTVFATRLALAGHARLRTHRHTAAAAQQLQTLIERRILDAADGYAARDALTHLPATSADTGALRDLVDLCALGRGLPPEHRAALDTATTVALDVIRATLT